MISSLTASSMYGYGDVDGPGFQPSGDDGLAHEKHVWIKKGNEAKTGMYREFSKQVETARLETAEKYLDAIERSILEPVVETKELIRKIPTGETTIDPKTGESVPVYKVTNELIRHTKAPDIKGAMWWLERRMDEFMRRIAHDAKVQVDGIPQARDVTIRMVRAWEDPEEGATETEKDQDAET